MDRALRTSFLMLLIAFLILFGAGSIVAKMNHGEAEANPITANTISVTNDNIIQVPNSHQKAPNTDQGTIVIWTKPPVEIFSQFSDARDYIIFYSATNIPGLRVVYNIKEKHFEAGAPLMSSPEVDIFDQKNHQIVYTFKKDGQQSIFLDGVKAATSDFKPIDSSKIVGFSFLEETADKVDIEGIEITAYDHSLTPEDLNR
ncbi:hypothetical protein ACFL3V_04845 [Nanoarchaeota archaeon]